MDTWSQATRNADGNDRVLGKGHLKIASSFSVLKKKSGLEYSVDADYFYISRKIFAWPFSCANLNHRFQLEKKVFEKL